ncbi:hypothetical protein D9757_012305 [Collybiopsis confluens]|uniref:Protein kinase domain-containing protein n=1 Tax=Collybiopsis confluens TaxID=2823264 RepID=A0A8H5LIX3_9AGAR|nr:hypothetical protein D9757_012305 [Collybiopsis confluens]
MFVHDEIVQKLLEDAQDIHGILVEALKNMDKRTVGSKGVGRADKKLKQIISDIQSIITLSTQTPDNQPEFTDTPSIELTAIPPPLPQPYPILPLWFHHLLPLRFSIIILLSLHNLVRPQFLYRGLAHFLPESTRKLFDYDNLSSAQEFGATAGSNTESISGLWNMKAAQTAAAIDWTKAIPERIQADIGPSDIALTLPSAVDKSLASTISHVVIDEDGRLVTDLGRFNVLRAPDFSVIHPLLIHGNDSLIALVENKFQNQSKAVAQLKAYAKDHAQNSPRMWCFAFVLTTDGLNIAMFKLKEDSELAAIAHDPDLNGGSEGVWYPVTHEFVHRKMVELLNEVRNEWDLQWFDTKSSALLALLLYGKPCVFVLQLNVERQLKEANILVTDDRRCCLADFGLSVITTSSQAWARTTSSNFTGKGTVRWLAPEYLASEIPNRPSRDIYAFGCTVLEIFTQKPPFSDRKNEIALLSYVMNGGRPDRPQDDRYSDALWGITTLCWAQNIEERPSADQIHECLNGKIDAFEQIVRLNPGDAKALQRLGRLYLQDQCSFQNQELAVHYFTQSLGAGKYKRTISLLQITFYVSDSSDSQSWYFLGQAYKASQIYSQAYQAYQQAIYRDSGNPAFRCSIGILFFHFHQFRNALDAYSRAIRVNPYISELWFNLGGLYENGDQITDAIDAYTRASELDPENRDISNRLQLLKTAQATGGRLPVALAPRDVHPTAYANQPSCPIGPSSAGFTTAS